jgi:hypothetical protein
VRCRPTVLKKSFLEIFAVFPLGNISPNHLLSVFTKLLDYLNVGTLHAQFRLKQHPIHPKRFNHFFLKLVERFAWLDIKEIEGEKNGPKFRPDCAVSMVCKARLPAPLISGAERRATSQGEDLVLNLRRGLLGRRACYRPRRHNAHEPAPRL